MIEELKEKALLVEDQGAQMVRVARQGDKRDLPPLVRPEGVPPCPPAANVAPGHARFGGDLRPFGHMKKPQVFRNDAAALRYRFSFLSPRRRACYSYLSARIGSTREARRAGM